MDRNPHREEWTHLVVWSPLMERRGETFKLVPDASPEDDWSRGLLGSSLSPRQSGVTLAHTARRATA